MKKNIAKTVQEAFAIKETESTLEVLRRAFKNPDNSWMMDGHEMRRLAPDIIEAWNAAIREGWMSVTEGGDSQYTALYGSLTEAGRLAIQE